MNKIKKTLTSLVLSITITLGAVSIPTQKANAGVIVMVASSTVAMPAALAIAGMFGGLGTVVSSIYYAIAHTDQAWFAWGFFMLDEQIQSGKTNELIKLKYPEMDSVLVDEISNLIVQKASHMEMNTSNYKEVVLNEQELATVLGVLDATNPILAKAVRQDLTQSSIQ